MITLEITHPEGLVRKSGGESFVVTAGKSLKIETSPRGDDIMDEEVPDGKKWDVSVSVQVTETDA